MGIHTMMTNALKVQWSKSDDFQFRFINHNLPLQIGGLTPQDLFDITVKNINTPQMESGTDATVMANTYRISTGQFDSFTFDITFIDLEGNPLRNYFSMLWMAQQTRYFDEIKSEVEISNGGTQIFKSTECLITNISTLQLANDNTQINEFTVSFKSPIFSNSDIEGFGQAGVDPTRKNK